MNKIRCTSTSLVENVEKKIDQDDNDYTQMYTSHYKDDATPNEESSDEYKEIYKVLTVHPFVAHRCANFILTKNEI